jgi:hypothetical protein
LRHTGISGTTARSWNTGGDTESKRSPRAAHVAADAVDDELAVTVLVRAGEDLDERGLAGTVVSEHAGDLAGSHDVVMSRRAITLP